MKLPFHDRKFRWLFAGVLVAVGFELAALLGYRIPEPYAPLLFGALILSLGGQVVWKGFRALLGLDFSNIKLLMLVAVAGAFYLGEYVEGAVVILVYLLGEELEDAGIAQSKAALRRLADRSPKTARLVGFAERVPVDRVAVGSALAVRPGEMVPLDGKVRAGESSVDEAAITGEPLPKSKAAGDEVYAGTLNREGYLEIVTTKAHADTTFSKIIQITFEATRNKSETQRFIQRFAKKYTPAVMLLAALLVAVPVFFLGQDFGHWLNQAITILVISCPCALVISTPVAVYAAIGNASARGAIVKGGKFLESLGKLRAVAFDKTRTLTKGRPVVSDLLPIGCDEEELLACTAGAELFSEHPLAQAIVEAAARAGYAAHPVENFRSVAGKGAKARCKVCAHKDLIVGKLDFVREHHAVEEEVLRAVERLQAEGKTSVVVSHGKKVAGVIGLADEIREESAAAVAELREMGVWTAMLTGDQEETARFVAARLKIRELRANLLPEQKAQALGALRDARGPVAMVGDGVNDAPALAMADVGVAMSAAGSDAAIEVAAVSLLNDHLPLVPYLIRLGRKTNARIRQNTALAVAVKLLFLLLAAAGHGSIVAAIFADVGVMLLVVLLSLRLMNFEAPTPESQPAKGERPK